MERPAPELDTMVLLAILFSVVKELYRRFDPTPGVYFDGSGGPYSSGVAYMPGTIHDPPGPPGPSTPPGPSPNRGGGTDSSRETTPERVPKRRRQ